MTKHERITHKLVLDDPEVWRLGIDTLPNGRYEVTLDHSAQRAHPDCIIASWSAVINEVTSFYTTLEAIECL